MSEKSNRLKAENARLRVEHEAAVKRASKYRRLWLAAITAIANDPRIGGPMP